MARFLEYIPGTSFLHRMNPLTKLACALLISIACFCSTNIIFLACILVLDFALEQNLVLQRYFEPEFTDKAGFLRRKNIRAYAERLIKQYDVRSGQGAATIARSMSGGNQQKAIIAREVDRDKPLIIAVQPTRGLDVGAIEYIHKQLVAQRDAGKAVLLVSLELDEVLDVPDRILVMYEGEIVGELDPKKTTVEELGLYMAGAKRMAKEEAAV